MGRRGKGKGGNVCRPPCQTRTHPVLAVHVGPFRQESLDGGYVALPGCLEQLLVLSAQRRRWGDTRRSTCRGMRMCEDLRAGEGAETKGERLTRPAARAQGEKAAGSAPETAASLPAAQRSRGSRKRHFSRKSTKTAAGTTPGASRCSDGRRPCRAARREALRRVPAAARRWFPQDLAAGHTWGGGLVSSVGASEAREGGVPHMSTST
jgi:hypothetical protein